MRHVRSQRRRCSRSGCAVATWRCGPYGKRICRTSPRSSRTTTSSTRGPSYCPEWTFGTTAGAFSARTTGARWAPGRRRPGASTSRSSTAVTWSASKSLEANDFPVGTDGRLGVVAHPAGTRARHWSRHADGGAGAGIRPSATPGPPSHPPATDNGPSLGVSRRIGYLDNGVSLNASHHGVVELTHLRLTAEGWRATASVARSLWRVSRRACPGSARPERRQGAPPD